MPERSARLRPPAFALLLAASIPAGLFAEDAKAPRLEPVPAIPAMGHARLTDVHAERWYCGPTALLLSTVGGGDNQFSLEVRLRTGSLTLSSPGGEMSCDLPEKAGGSATGQCRFNVGGGHARTTVTCPGNGLMSARAEKLIHVTAERCRAVALGCALVASLDVTIVMR